jgi:hypothetical protein
MFPSCQCVTQAVPTIYPSSFQYVQIKFLMHSRYVPKLSMCYSSCSHQIPIKFSTCSHQFLMHSWYVPKLSMCYSSCSHHIPIKFSTCSNQIPDAFPICSQVVNVLLKLFPPNSHQVFNMFTSNSWCIPDMFPKLSMCSSSCSHQIPIKFSTCSHQIPDAFLICSQVSMCSPSCSHQIPIKFSSTSNFQCIPNMFPSCSWIYQDVPNSTTLHLITFGQSWILIMYIGEALLEYFGSENFPSEECPKFQIF